MKLWRRLNRSIGIPSHLAMIGNCRTRNAGTGARISPMLAVLLTSLMSKTSLLKATVSRSNRWPAKMAHKMLMTGTLNIDLNSTRPLGSDLDDSLISSINSTITSIIWSSIEVLPKPKSLKWRNVNLLCSCHNGPDVKIKPVSVLVDDDIALDLSSKTFVVLICNVIFKKLPKLSPKERVLKIGPVGRLLRSSFKRVSLMASSPLTEMNGWVGPKNSPVTDPYFLANVCSVWLMGISAEKRFKLPKNGNPRGPFIRPWFCKRKALFKKIVLIWKKTNLEGNFHVVVWIFLRR